MADDDDDDDDNVDDRRHHFIMSQSQHVESHAKANTCDVVPNSPANISKTAVKTPVSDVQISSANDGTDVSVATATTSASSV
jgi:hypothetical protein